jgi:hypothetical protein
MRSRAKKLILIAPLAMVGMVVFIMIGGTIVMLLWNWLAPALFGLRLITFWQALGILVLCRILFGGFGLHGGGRRSRLRHMDERWKQMTSDERAQWRQRMRERWGGGPSKGETTPL